MATLICSQGHPNPVGQHFCGACGEDLTRPSAASQEPNGREPDGQGSVDEGAPDPEPPEDAAPRYPTWARLVVGLLGLMIVATLIALVVLVLDRRSTSPSRPTTPATTPISRGDQVGVVYFPATTDETTLVARVAAECADHPEFGSIQVNLLNLDTGNFDTGQAHTYPCP